MSYEFIVLERDGGVGTITMNRARVLNALNRAMYREIDAAISELEEDDSIAAIVITGAGERAFSAGADIHEMARIAEETGSQDGDPDRARHMWHLATCSKPTIGAINGLAYGGGAVIAASMDIRVGSERASFRFLAAAYGRVNSTWNLPMQIGWPKAKELLFTGRVVKAREALEIGLLNHLVAPEMLMPKAMEIARAISANDIRIVKGIKELMIRDVGVSWHEMQVNELEAQADALKPPPVREGFDEFLSRKGSGG